VGWTASTDKAVGVVSYDLLNLKKLGVNVPIGVSLASNVQMVVYGLAY